MSVVDTDSFFVAVGVYVYLLNAGVERTSLLRDGGDLDGSVDHREGRQHWIKVGVDQVSGFGHGVGLVYSDKGHTERCSSSGMSIPWGVHL